MLARLCLLRHKVAFHLLLVVLFCERRAESTEDIFDCESLQSGNGNDKHASKCAVKDISKDSCPFLTVCKLDNITRKQRYSQYN